MLSSLCLLITLLTTFSAALPNLYFNRNPPHTTKPKLSLADSAEWTEYHIREPEGPGTYSFGYDVEDSQTGNVQFRTEERHPNGTVTGSYGFVTPEGYVHVIHYVADHLGYRAKIEDSRRVKSSNVNDESLNISKEISPQMIAALQSLGNYEYEKEDHRIRPIDRINSNSPNIVPISFKKENFQEKKNKVYFVPPNYNNN